MTKVGDEEPIDPKNITLDWNGNENATEVTLINTSAYTENSKYEVRIKTKEGKPSIYSIPESGAKKETEKAIEKAKLSDVVIATTFVPLYATTKIYLKGVDQWGGSVSGIKASDVKWYIAKDVMKDANVKLNDICDIENPICKDNYLTINTSTDKHCNVGDTIILGGNYHKGDVDIEMQDVKVTIADLNIAHVEFTKESVDVAIDSYCEVEYVAYDSKTQEIDYEAPEGC